MQVHNYGAGQTLFAYNHWNGDSTSNLGIGNQVGGSGQPDWTFNDNAGTYTTRLLQILVGTPAPSATLTWDGTVNDWSSAHWTPGPVAGPNDLTTKGVVAGGNVTVDGDFTAHSLQLDGGQVTMGPNHTLTLARGIESSGGTLALTDGSRVITDLAGGTIPNTGGICPFVGGDCIADLAGIWASERDRRCNRLPQNRNS